MVTELLSGVIIDGLTTFVTSWASKAAPSIVSKEMAESLDLCQPSFKSVLTSSIAKFADKEEHLWKNPDLYVFLRSPAVESIVRQVYSLHILSSKQPNTLQEIRQEFLQLFTISLGWPEERATSSGEVLFSALLAGCNQALDIATEKNLLIAHEAKSNLRQHLLLSELNSIRKNIELLTGISTTDIKSILDYENRYRSQVAHRHQYITPPNFDNNRKFPINSLYVPSGFNLFSESRQNSPEQKLSVAEFRSIIFRTVLLGNPGGGKSTFTSKLAYDLSTEYPKRFLGGRLVTPIHVVLRDYGALKKKNPCSILEYITLTAESIYQLPSPPSGAFEYLMLNGHVMVIFDGLDELLDTSYRQEISSDIEVFCNLFPSVPALVTSRKVGYEQAPLDPKIFEAYILSSFDDDAVRSYTEKWFGLDTDLPPDQRSRSTKIFLEESSSVPDLRSNPLLLALMCNIYRGDGYIPKNRPDVYEKCATMLFERWDKGRGIHYVLPFEAHMRPAMMYIAHWLYSDETRQSGITEAALLTPTSQYLHKHRFENWDEAEYAARALIEFCRGRAWVFTDTGTTKEGERLYQFTHRTFLEYFTAAHLVRTCRIPERLVDILLPKIKQKEWDMVAQLAVQIQSKQLEGAGDEILTDLLVRATQDSHFGEAHKKHTLSFIARCLEFIVPTPVVKVNIAEMCTKFVLEQGVRAYQSRRPETMYVYRDEPAELVVERISATSVENRATVASTLEKCFAEYMQNPNTVYHLVVLELIWGISRESWRGISRAYQIKEWEFWHKVFNRLYSEYLPTMRELMHSTRWLAWGLLKDEADFDLNVFVKWFGIDSLLQDIPYFMWGSFTLAPFSSFLLAVEHGAISEEEFYRLRKNLLQIGSTFLSIPLPCFSLTVRRRGQYQFHYFPHPRETNGLDHFDHYMLFALFVIYATWTEIGKSLPDDLNKTSLFPSQEYKSFSLFKPLLQLRTGPSSVSFTPEITSLLDRFSAEEKIFIEQWIRREISLFGDQRRRKHRQ